MGSTCNGAFCSELGYSDKPIQDGKRCMHYPPLADKLGAEWWIVQRVG